MALEAGTYIDALVPSNPANSDQQSQGAAHLRLIKQALKNTFSKVTGAVTLTHDQINDLPNRINPVGFIGVWYGSAETVPSGWAVCNGQVVELADGSGTITTPDLRGMFVMGATATVLPGATGGASSATVSTSTVALRVAGTTAAGGAHTPTITVEGHALTEAEMPSHKHLNGVVDKNDNLFNHGGAAADPTMSGSIDGNSSRGVREGYTSSVGGGQAHTHKATAAAVDGHTHTLDITTDAHGHTATVATLPPYRALHYIMKV